MKYFELHQLLKRVINYDDDYRYIDPQTHIHSLHFESENYSILPGEDIYACNKHPEACFDGYHYDPPRGIINKILDIHDSQVSENRFFRYHVFTPAKEGKADSIIILFHGFNEKHWHKYLPWAKRLMEDTGKAVVLFPIAFHMNRAPHQWSDRRLMYQVSELRKKNYPDVLHSTLSNVAISSRIQARPERFFWSGIQTYYDVLQLIGQIKEDKHPFIARDASIDFFAYSIGSLLAEILMMTNPAGIFGNSKLCMFCGGSVFSRMSPVSKFILDSEANVALYSYMIEHLESHLKNNFRLRHYFGNDHSEGIALLSMLNYKSMKTFREDAFRVLRYQMMAIALEKDSVIPPYEIINTLQGSARNIPIVIESLDFPYDYKHEDPFPVVEHLKEEVNHCFCEVFDMVAKFLA